MLMQKIVMASLLGCLLASSPSAHATAQSELQDLKNVVNNSIPEKYRDQLNNAIRQLENEMGSGCSSSPVYDNGAPQCEVRFSNAHSRITRGSDEIQGWSVNHAQTLEKLRSLQNMGFCSSKRAPEKCEVLFSNGHARLAKDGQEITGWTTNHATVADVLSTFRNAGICL